MSNNPPNKSLSLISLSNLAELISLILVVSYIFSIIKLFFYYNLFLHIPIFQYLELGDLLLMTPTGICWALYVGSVEAASFIRQSDHFTTLEKIGYGIFCYSLGAFVVVESYRNEPIIEQSLIMPFRHLWYWIPFALYIIIRMKGIEKGSDFFSKQKIVGLFILTIWYGIYDSWSNYEAMTNPSGKLTIVVKLKSGQKIKTGSNLLYAGRTKQYWFLYNTHTKYVRALNNELVETADFNTFAQ